MPWAVTLPSAMAASGAAINANAAYVGAGVTRDRLISIVMTLLNLRLGMWVASPTNCKRRVSGAIRTIGPPRSVTD